jgi:hypothetical protein
MGTRSTARRAVLATALGGALLAVFASGATGASPYTGTLTVSATTVKVGGQITVTETATNLTSSQVSFITVGIRRLGFDVVSATKPRTGICRIAGSATCSNLSLNPHETQSYTLVLKATTAGSYQIQGWTTQPSAGGAPGVSYTVPVTVTN